LSGIREYKAIRVWLVTKVMLEFRGRKDLRERLVIPELRALRVKRGVTALKGTMELKVIRDWSGMLVRKATRATQEQTVLREM